MHFNFHFSAAQIFWTLTFAALLVLLVVLLGRDRVRRYPWFTAGMVMMALRMLAARLLLGRMSQMASTEIFLVLADVSAIVAVAVAVEMARRAFKGAGRIAWMVAGLILPIVAGVVVWKWGAWPSAQTLFAASTLSYLRLMQLFAQKADLLADVLIIQLSLLVAFFGRAYKAGWRSHTQQIVIGLSTASIAQLAVRAIWQTIALHTTVHSQAEYQHVMDLQEKFYNANSVIFMAVLVWWIVCLWIDEPGAKAVEAPAQGAGKDADAANGESEN